MKWIAKKTARATENAEAWLGDKFNSLRHTLRVEDAMNRLDHQLVGASPSACAGSNSTWSRGANQPDGAGLKPL